jgi:hypothetical protein
MPVRVIRGYQRQIARIRAERVLEGAQMACAPHLTKDGAKRWWDSWERQARAQPQVPWHRQSALFWEGQPIRGQALKRELSKALGSGFAA